MKNHRQGLWRYHFISEQTLKRLSWWKYKLHSLKTHISQFKTFSESLSAKYFPSIRCLSLGIIAINFFHAEIVFTLPFPPYDDGEIEKRGRQQIFRLFFERKNLKLYTCKCILAKTTTCKLALIFRNIKWPRNQASRSSWRSFGDRYIRNRKQQALLRNFFPSRTKDILTLLHQKIRDFC